MSRNYQEELLAAKAAARAAGKVVMQYYEAGDYDIAEKSRNNPVTTADTEADTLLKERLKSTFPEYGWLSEESKDNPERLDKELVWVVDPIDGTKEFITGVPEFVISIGLVRNGEPVVGVLYNPVEDELYSASRGGGAYLNDDKITVSETTKLSDASLLVSRTETRNGHVDKFSDYIGEFKPTGSVAYKLCLASAGRGDVFVSVYSKNEWDVCAGDLVVQEAGGTMSDIYGNPVVYNKKKTKIHDGIIAGNATIAEQMLELTEKLDAEEK
ncbi:MAG: 3'(2'),5'-bisphosphate nucleotidase CysQ [Candidatus Marinimicrobia bacterium]|nr:3'(2'),5'-bisphosphate nucleotidase CysQ [Candidatus Neomarinimicrobiota bacterium]MCF7828868.1 3'(2'),5'-bisphosphate nucleotidase CysQ [Candidatus Neomarinimicrobiota bacterium]MCF7880786.1 3'(2'),5'-bisphosphate nucleotidase CysQ [Candidatus Neomarinimicrobiota bacterium]